MRKSAYLQRLKNDLDRWVDTKWISADLSEKMYADASQQEFRALHSSSILPGLATLTIVLGLLAIIASNWSEFSGVVRLGLYFVLLAVTVLGAGEARQRGHNTVSNMTATIAAALAGGGLVVIGQLYHTSATTAAFLGAWTYLALVTALLLRSPLAAALTALLAIFWTTAHHDGFGVLFRNYDGAGLPIGPLWLLPPFIALVLIAIQGRTLSLIHLLFIGVMFWITPALWKIVSGNNTPDTLSILALAVIWLAIAGLFEFLARSERFWAVRTVSGWSAWMFALYLAAAVAAERFQSEQLSKIGLAFVSLAVFSALTAYGSAPGRRWIRGAGVAGFIAVSIIFFTMADNLLNAGLAMITFGGALIALLVVTNKMLHRASGIDQAGAAS